MANLKEEFTNNKPTWVWRGSITGLFLVLGFLGSWMFTEVSAAPKVYVNKADQVIVDDRQDRQQEALEKKIDEGFKETQRIILDLHKK